MSDLIGKPIKFDADESRQLTIPTVIPETIIVQEEIQSIQTPPESIDANAVTDEGGIVIPDNLPIKLLYPEKVVQITIPTEQPIYTVKERSDDELSPGTMHPNTLQKEEPLLYPEIPIGSTSDGKVSWDGEKPVFLKDHLSQDFKRVNNLVTINRDDLTELQVYEFVFTNLTKAGRLDFIKARKAEISTLEIDGKIIVLGVESSDFISGYTGEGYAIRKLTNGSTLEVDNIFVRKTIRSFASEVNRIKSTNGTLFAISSTEIISQSLLLGTYTFALNTNIPFEVNDIIITRRLDGIVLNETMWRVTAVNTGLKTFDCVKLSGTNIDVVGCIAARIGNTVNAARRGTVRISDDESGNPFIEVTDLVDSDTKNGNIDTVMARIGNLVGINDPRLGRLEGYGIYCKRIFGIGQMILNKQSIFETDTSTITATEIEESLDLLNQYIITINETLSDINDAFQAIYSNYYTKTQLQSNGESEVHWGNISNTPSTYAPSSHTHELEDVNHLVLNLNRLWDEKIDLKTAIGITIALG